MLLQIPSPAFPASLAVVLELQDQDVKDRQTDRQTLVSGVRVRVGVGENRQVVHRSIAQRVDFKRIGR